MVHCWWVYNEYLLPSDKKVVYTIYHIVIKNYNQKDGWPFTNFTGESKSMPERLTALLIFMSINNYTSTPSLSFLKNKTSPSLLIKCICE